MRENFFNKVSKTSLIKFFKHEYPKDHWSINYSKAGTSIATVRVRNKYNYSIMLNPNDCRGYRTIIRYLNDVSSDISSALNRKFTVPEQKGLNDVTLMMEQVYQRMGLIPQFSLLGNNSHVFDEKTGSIQMGNIEEPNILHLHLWGRGNPVQEYIPGVPLRGPQPGLMFELIAKSQENKTTQQSIKWDPKELEICLSAFKEALLHYVESDEFKNEFGDFLNVTIEPEKKTFSMIACSSTIS